MNQAKEKTCFVVMPFGGFFENRYKETYAPAILEAGLKPRRVDDLYSSTPIIQDVWNCTLESRMVLADLTGFNPNVFYELGLAHAVPKQAILISESTEELPFDLRHLRVLKYEFRDPNWGKKLKDDIVKAITHLEKFPNDSILIPFLKIRPSGPEKEITSEQKTLLEINQRLANIERNLPTRVAPGLATEIGSIGSHLQEMGLLEKDFGLKFLQKTKDAQKHRVLKERDPDD